MIIRVIKNHLRDQFREQSKVTLMPSDEPYRRYQFECLISRLVVGMLNNLFGSSRRANFWPLLKVMVEDNYESALTPQEQHSVYPFEELTLKYDVFKRATEAIHPPSAGNPPTLTSRGLSSNPPTPTMEDWTPCNE